MVAGAISSDAMSSSERRVFHPGWVLVAFFLICGGIFAAAVVAGVLELHSRTAGYVAFTVGATVGGLFAGRASPHRGILEPAVAGALVIGATYLFLSQTIVGGFVIAFEREQVTREALILGGLAFGGGFAGAVVGELSRSGPPSASALRWAGVTMLATAGALLVAMIVTNAVMIDQALKESGAMARLLQGTLVDTDTVARAMVIALAAAALLGGLITQMAAPVRLIATIGLSVVIVYAALLAAAVHLAGGFDSDSAFGIAVIAVAGGVVAVIAAVIGWLLVRRYK